MTGRRLSRQIPQSLQLLHATEERSEPSERTENCDVMWQLPPLLVYPTHLASPPPPARTGVMGSCLVFLGGPGFRVMALVRARARVCVCVCVCVNCLLQLQEKKKYNTQAGMSM